jgi:hypothetical protein
LRELRVIALQINLQTPIPFFVSLNDYLSSHFIIKRTWQRIRQILARWQKL